MRWIECRLDPVKPEDAVDLNLTHAIVGAPMSVSLGRRATLEGAGGEGFSIDLRRGSAKPAGAWVDWWMLYSGEQWFTGPRRRPGPVRVWLEKHALVIAVAGIALLAIEAVAFVLWSLTHG